MPTYRITKFKSGKTPKPIETREIEARTAGEACDHLGWKLFQCSFELISGELDRWNAAKERIRKAYRRTPVIAKLPWGDYDKHKMNDIELIEAEALEAEHMADMMRPDAEGPDIEERLTDTYLLATFAFERHFTKIAEHTRTHCCYCNQTGDLVSWDISRHRAIEEDKALSIYVCLVNQSCWQKALDDGYTAISNNRRCYVEMLAKQGKTQKQIQEILRVSRSTVSKDFRILKRKGRL